MADINVLRMVAEHALIEADELRAETERMKAKILENEEREADIRRMHAISLRWCEPSVFESEGT